MVAPIDAKSTFEVEGETITLRLNFRTISLAAEHGVNVLGTNGFDLEGLNAVKLCKCLAIEDHPDLTNEEALAIYVKASAAYMAALADLFGKFSGKHPEGNEKGRKAKK